ncbi:MAG: type II secretion system F family protein [Anaerolineales bacterium]|nr:type II secretion system F family protein [Anaerolineales bacterium]
MSGLTIFLVVGGIIAVGLLAVGLFVSIRSERSLVDERLGQFLEEAGSAETAKAERSALTEWVNRQAKKSSTGERIARQLARADLKFQVGEYFALIVISTVGTAAIFWLLAGGGFQARGIGTALAGGLVGAFIPSLYVRSQQGKRLRRFNDQLSDMLNLMVNGLRAGYSVMQAMEAVSKELPPPISDEFRRVVQEMQIGIPMETALENLYRRIPSDDLDFVITAVNVQREVGGNLSEILDTISFTIRERVRIKGEIRVLTSQVRTSGTAMALIPIFLVVFLWFLNPEYMGSFFDKGPLCGFGALGLAAVLIVTGYAIMMKIADIEV